MEVEDRKCTHSRNKSMFKLHRIVYKKKISPINQTPAKNELSKITPVVNMKHNVDEKMEGFTSQLKGERKDSSLLNSVLFKTKLNESSEDDSTDSSDSNTLNNPS